MEINQRVRKWSVYGLSIWQAFEIGCKVTYPKKTNRQNSKEVCAEVYPYNYSNVVFETKFILYCIP